eukprot:COSAG02_NODE_6280_length_3681_cov_40.378042_1_plen_136_part_00
MGDDDEQVFAVRLALPDGSSRKVHCDPYTNVEQILQAVSAKVSLLALRCSARSARQRETARRPSCAWLTARCCNTQLRGSGDGNDFVLAAPGRGKELPIALLVTHAASGFVRSLVPRVPQILPSRRVIAYRAWSM